MGRDGDGERFLAAFAEMKTAVQDNPDLLETMSKDNPRLQQLCDELFDQVRGFEIGEEWSRHALTPNVSVASARARRDYSERWREVVYRVAHRDLLASIKFDLSDLIGVEELSADDLAAVGSRKSDQLAVDIDDWKYEAREDARALSILFDVIANREEAWLDVGLQTWDRLTDVAGLDVEGVLWRRRALPHVLVPEHVARHYGASRASLYHRLLQAEKAFVFGAPLAALALQRAVLEEVLRAHWGAEGDTLTDVVKTAHMPELAWDARADRLRRLANKALHYDPQNQTPETTDRALIEFFLLLRLLIENAPEASARP